jgi:hypothetical protein
VDDPPAEAELPAVELPEPPELPVPVELSPVTEPAVVELLAAAVVPPV